MPGHRLSTRMRVNALNASNALNILETAVISSKSGALLSTVQIFRFQCFLNDKNYFPSSLFFIHRLDSNLTIIRLLYFISSQPKQSLRNSIRPRAITWLYWSNLKIFQFNESPVFPRPIFHIGHFINDSNAPVTSPRCNVIHSVGC